MNDIQKFFYDRMIAALYEANGELISNIRSKDSNRYFKFVNKKETLASEISDSFKEIETHLNNSIEKLNSEVDVSLKYNYLHAGDFGIFDAK